MGFFRRMPEFFNYFLVPFLVTHLWEDKIDVDKLIFSELHTAILVFIKFLIYRFKGNLPTYMNLVNRWYISRADTFILTPPLKPVKLHQKTIWTNTSEQSFCLINIRKRMWYSLSPHVPILPSLSVLHHASLYESVSRTGVLIFSDTFWW